MAAPPGCGRPRKAPPPRASAGVAAQRSGTADTCRPTGEAPRTQPPERTASCTRGPPACPPQTRVSRSRLFRAPPCRAASFPALPPPFPPCPPFSIRLSASVPSWPCPPACLPCLVSVTTRVHPFLSLCVLLLVSVSFCTPSCPPPSHPPSYLFLHPRAYATDRFPPSHPRLRVTSRPPPLVDPPPLTFRHRPFKSGRAGGGGAAPGRRGGGGGVAGTAARAGGGSGGGGVAGTPGPARRFQGPPGRAGPRRSAGPGWRRGAAGDSGAVQDVRQGQGLRRAVRRAGPREVSARGGGGRGRNGRTDGRSDARKFSRGFPPRESGPAAARRGWENRAPHRSAPLRCGAARPPTDPRSR